MVQMPLVTFSLSLRSLLFWIDLNPILQPHCSLSCSWLTNHSAHDNSPKATREMCVLVIIVCCVSHLCNISQVVSLVCESTFFIVRHHSSQNVPPPATCIIFVPVTAWIFICFSRATHIYHCALTDYTISPALLRPVHFITSKLFAMAKPQLFASCLQLNYHNSHYAIVTIPINHPHCFAFQPRDIYAFPVLKVTADNAMQLRWQATSNRK